jgi:DeoR family myo-inositol catabolism operon transcriptional repressor
MRSQRLNSLQEYIFEKKLVSLPELCDHFGVSLSTLRRDLVSLEQRGLIKKTYGGVAAQPARQLITPYESRNIINREAKLRIAQAAAGLVNDGDIIYIDSGSTVMAMVDFLEKSQGVTILTNNLNVIVRAVHMENIQVISLSGTLNRQVYSFTGDSAAKILARYNINKSFMGCTGISLTNGVTNSSATEVEIKRTAIERSPHNILLLDSSKVGVISLFTYCSLEDLHVVVTDKELPEEYTARFARTDAKILVAR